MRFLLNLLICFLVIAFFLPNILSTKWGTKTLSDQLEKRVGLKIESMQLSWFKPQLLNGVTFINGNKQFFSKEIVLKKNEFLLHTNVIGINDHYFKGDLISLTFDKIHWAYSWKKLHIPHMTLALGKMTWQNFGVVTDLLSVIQLRPNLNTDIPLWFQDTPASLTNGILHFDRTEFLVDNAYEFAFWNTINLSTQELDLAIGLPASTLQKVFDIQHLPENYTIPMRFTGPFNDPHLHKSRALKTIGKLLLLKNLPLAPLPEVKPSPSPRRPFPWH